MEPSLRDFGKFHCMFCVGQQISDFSQFFHTSTCTRSFTWFHIHLLGVCSLKNEVWVLQERKCEAGKAQTFQLDVLKAVPEIESCGTYHGISKETRPKIIDSCLFYFKTEWLTCHFSELRIFFLKNPKTKLRGRKPFSKFYFH